MAFFKCKMCGGTIEFEPGASVGVCDSCGTKQTLPRLDDEVRANLYDRANHYRRNNEYDKAASIYEQILNEDLTDAEAYWSLVLCRYGIEYVEDPATHKQMPTVNRTQFTSIFDDENYKSALQYADGNQRELYEKEAKTINEIQKGILAVSQREAPFDIFICYKETDKNGRRTPDSVLATDLYHQLIQEGFKVFFARITLEDKLGMAYEPYIFAALNTAKVMIVLGTKPEYFNAVWVKNEWSRFLALVKESNGKKILIPAYRDMDPYDLPEEFSHLQAQDMSKLGFMQDLIRGIRKITNKAVEPKTTVKETVVLEGSANADSLLKRVFLFLEDGSWDEADEYCEKVLDLDPENARAYLGKLMVELRVHHQEDLSDCAQPFDNSNNYQKALRFGGKLMQSMLSGFISHINERNENDRINGIYNDAVSAMNVAKTNAAFKAAADSFKTIPGFKDADSLADQCLDRAEVCRKKEVSESANSEMAKGSIIGYENAITLFKVMSSWQNTDEQIETCKKRIEELKKKEETARAERERKKRVRRRKVKIALASIISCIICFTIVFLILWFATSFGTLRYEYTCYPGGESGYVVTCNKKFVTSVEIPAEHNGVKVIGIGYEAFKDCTKLTSITIPDSVTRIENSAFHNCVGLTSVTIPANVKSIGSYAFSDCFSLTSVIIPASVNSISSYAFADCISLSYVTISNGVSSIERYAFSNCERLTSVTIPKSVTSIGEAAFSGCSALKSITIPFVGNKKTANENERYPFGYIFGTKSYRGGVLTRQDDIGLMTVSLTNMYYIPSSLKSVTVTGGEIVYGAFNNCSELTAVTIGTGVETISDYAFRSCSALTSVTIPSSVKSIGQWSFIGCDALSAVYYTGDVAGWCGIPFDAVGSNPLNFGHNLYINGKLVTDLVIPNTVTSIGFGAFQGCSCLTSVTISDSVTSIGGGAFYDCTGLTSVTMGKKVTSIGHAAFFNCNRLTSVTIPNSVTSFGNSAFYNCTRLTSVTYQGTITQWNAINKGLEWNSNTGNYTVHCTNGDCSK